MSEKATEFCPTCGGPVEGNGIKARSRGYRPGFHCRIVAMRSGQLVKCWSIKVHGSYGVCDTRYPICKRFLVWDRICKESRKKKANV